jgi:predicted  nucleic acid-binding Zn-ribbon protein
MAKLFRSFGGYLSMKTRKAVENVSDEISGKDLADIRERIVRLEVQLADVIKRLDNLSSYTRQLYDYLNRSSR